MKVTTDTAGACPRGGVLSVATADALRNVSAAGATASRKGLAFSVLAASSGVILASALAIAPVTPARAQAQQPAQKAQPQGKQLEEITVTGSRIRRQDFTANAPITTIGQANFQNTATVGVETVLNQLPQFVPAIDQFTTTDVQQTANNTIGGAFVSLRGLGPNRNLVLIDGKRAQPANPQMFVDTNMIPAAMIQRVEVISGGASAVYGADAVGGVVNFILKDNYEGASVEARVGDTQHGGNQETLISAIMGANVAGNKGNVMLGLSRATRSKVLQQDRSWRVADMANPSTPGTAFGWGSDTWVSSTVSGTPLGAFVGTSLDALSVGNYPDQNFVNNYFGQAQPCTPAPAGSEFFSGYLASSCPQNANGTNLGVPNNTRFLINRPSGTVYTGLMDPTGAAGSYLYEGPYNGDQYGNFQGLPFRVVQPDGTIKENNFFQWASSPLERTSAFGKGHFDVSDHVKVTAQALFSRTHSSTSLGLSADNISFWGAPIPFGMGIYTGNSKYNIPDSCIRDLAGNCTATNPAYQAGGRFGVNCDAQPTPQEPWHDGLPGCTKTEAFPVPLDIWNLMRSRAYNEADIWVNRPPDYLREVDGPRRGENTTTTSQLSIGAEGDFGTTQHWDVTITSGYTDNLTDQLGSTRISTYRAILAFPNYGRSALFDPNPYINGFAESIPTCTSGLPVMTDFKVSQDCIDMLTPDLKNRETIKQNVAEANLTGDLLKMKPGPLSYALGLDYRNDSYVFVPDNLSLNANYIDPIAGLFPNAKSGGKYHVSELYGELLIPVVSNGPKGVDHFNFELGGRESKWSMPGVKTVGSYKALIDWGITPKFRLRGGVNRALRAPNLGELFIGRTQIFGGVSAQYQDQCSQNNQIAPYSANPAVAGAAQAAQTYAICRAMMGPQGAAAYYDNRPVTSQPTGVGFGGGGNGIQNSFGNPNLSEENADTFTMGIVMDFLQNWTLSLDYYRIDITNMIAVESPDTTYADCLGLKQNPTGSPNTPACQRIFRNPTDGTPANIDLSYTNLGEAKVAGVDINLNWRKPLAGGTFTINSVSNYNISSTTQDGPNAPAIEWKGTQGCALQIQCQGYEYRIFTTFSYFRGQWGVSLRHQFWPSILPSGCATPAASATACSTSLAQGGGVRTNYQLFDLSGSYRIGQKYELRVGIQNLLDKVPPLTGANPLRLPFAYDATHIGSGLGGGNGATYDPLGRRAFVSMTMNF